MKHPAVAATRRTLLIGIVAIALLIIITAGIHPGKASADVLSTQNAQLIPPGGNACPQVTASAFTPYIYSNGLDSFEFTVPDASYVALTGKVGAAAIPFQFMTRHTDAAGMLRIHVDIDTVRLTGAVPITVTLISARAGQPTCAAVVSMVLGSASAQSTSASSGAHAAVTTVAPAPAAPVVSTAPNTGSTMEASSSGTNATSVPIGNASATGSAVNSVQNLFKNGCATTSGAIRLWIVLLVLYALFVGALLWATWPPTWTWIREPEWVSSAILVLLILLLIFWFASVSCRGSGWMPLIAVVIAVVGIARAFWDHPRMQQLMIVE